MNSAENISSMSTRVYESWKDANYYKALELNEIYTYWDAYTCLSHEMHEMTNSIKNDNIDIMHQFVLEIENDFLASVLLSISGFPKNANSILRSCLESIFIGLWFSYDRNMFERWLNNGPDRPFKDRNFFKEKWLKELVNKLKVKENAISNISVDEIMNIYRDLSKATHTQDINQINTWEDSVPRFNKELFDIWFDNFKKVFEIMCMIIFIRYPKLCEEKSIIETNILAEIVKKLR